MSNGRSQITLFNNLQKSMQVGLEPEGDCIEVPVGVRCLIRGQDDASDFELVFEDDLISVHLDSIKEVELDGVRVR